MDKNYLRDAVLTIAALIVAGTTVQAETITASYITTEKFVSATPASETFDWTFTGPDVFNLVTTFIPLHDIYSPAPCTPTDCTFWWASGGITFLTGPPLSSAVQYHRLILDTGWGTPHVNCNMFVGVGACDPGIVNVADWTFIENCFGPCDPQIGGIYETIERGIGSYRVGDPSGDPPVATPEPASLVLVATGLLGFGLFFKRRRIAFLRNT